MHAAEPSTGTPTEPPCVSSQPYHAIGPSQQQSFGISSKTGASTIAPAGLPLPLPSSTPPTRASQPQSSHPGQRLHDRNPNSRLEPDRFIILPLMNDAGKVNIMKVNVPLKGTAYNKIVARAKDAMVEAEKGHRAAASAICAEIAKYFQDWNANYEAHRPASSSTSIPGPASQNRHSVNTTSPALNQNKSPHPAAFIRPHAQHLARDSRRTCGQPKIGIR